MEPNDDDWDTCDGEFGLCLDCGCPLQFHEFDTCTKCDKWEADNGVPYVPADDFEPPF